MKEKGKTNVLVVDDERNMLHMLSAVLKREGYLAETAASGDEALSRLNKKHFDFAIVDVVMPGMGGMELLEHITRKSPETTVIMMSAYGKEDDSVEAVKRGAYDYIYKPFKPEELILILKKAVERERLRKENARLKRRIAQQYKYKNIIARSEAMQKVMDAVERVCEYPITVLIQGESGTGKELIARLIHDRGIGKTGPFVAINCAAIPSNLLESELFGYTRGAFTDAKSDKKGLFVEANGGTLFLDEIGELPLEIQPKLLRVLQEGEIQPLGATRPIKVNVRIIAATVKDLSREVEKGSFREDLYYRVNVFKIVVPALRERQEDIVPLVEHFIDYYNAELGCNVAGVEPSAMALLIQYPWPGNVRELENVIQRAVILTEEGMIKISSLPPDVVGMFERKETVYPGEEFSIKKAVAELEKILIKKALEKVDGNRTKAAKLLEISYPALLSKMKQHGLG